MASCFLCSAAAYCCNAIASRAIAALLGRFLPRLGPLVHSSGLFFLLSCCLLLFRRRLERSEVAERSSRQCVREGGEIGRHLRKFRTAFTPAFVHVDRAVEFELDGVQAACRI